MLRGLLILALLFAQSTAQEQYELGIKYEKGEGGVPKDFARAMAAYRSAAEQGHAGAQRNLGLMYYFGEGVETNLPEAFRWISLSAGQGHAIAQYNVGLLYYFGSGTSKDLSRAVEWLTKSAEQGYPDAQFNLGVMSLNGEGTPPSLAKAVEWFAKAAEGGNAGAQLNLGIMYSGDNGGVIKDLVQAFKWAALAAEAGQDDAVQFMDFLSGMMTRDQISQAQQMAREWKPRQP